MSSFDLSSLVDASHTEYPRQIARVNDATGFTSAIEEAVSAASANLKDGCRSFVIYGEPQSGKTEMMICLTAKLLDDGYKNIVVLVNDSVDLQTQNLGRFRLSNLSPSPKSLADIKTAEALSNSIKTVIFCKKNQSDLKILIQKLRNIRQTVVIDDEADFATPNSKVNKPGEQSKINELVEQLLSSDPQSVYIGVTATPARLDLNNTYDNDSSAWHYFRPYPGYSGREVFFPSEDSESLEYSLVALPDEGDTPKYIYDALTRFLVNVAHLNVNANGAEKNYSMLVHTSGIKDDHHNEREQIEKFFDELQDKDNKNFAKRFSNIFDDAKERYDIEPNTLVEYIYKNRQRYAIKMVNSDAEKNPANLRGATDPESLFTVVVGGNIISRGVTFNNLLTMFFARTAQKMQQDTYVQRARMFGNRTGYLKYFELHIPELLYKDWHRAFTLLGLSMASIKTGNPVWMEDNRIRAAATSSIEKATLSIDKGEISFEKFAPSTALIALTDQSISGFTHFEKLVSLLPDDYLSQHILDFVRTTHGKSNTSLLFHKTRVLGDSGKELDAVNISRSRGMYGGLDYEADLFPGAVHHFKLFVNKQGEGRVIYSYRAPEKIRFIRSRRRSSK
jgi:hypothetical protein